MNQLKKKEPIHKLALLGIGTNKGNRKKNIVKALKLLTGSKKIKFLKISKILRNRPKEGIKGGYFLNGVLKIQTSLSPLKLLKLCKSIEKKLGRVETKDKKKRSREIDLDILFYGNKIINTKDLVVPHPRLYQRDFVLIPLAEIEPGLIYPLHPN